jgi:GAF domain-containing protein
MTSEAHTWAGNRSLAVADVFVTLADTLVADYDVVDLMDRLVNACAELFDITAAGLLLIDQRGSLQVVASSNEQAHLLELFQLQSDQGPCLDCISTGQPVTVGDLDDARQRWPRFIAAAAAGGLNSVHAVPMRLRTEVIGALNLFGSDRRALTADEQRLAQALADVATIGILQQRSAHRSAILAEQLQTALDSRITIEQAKGVLAQLGRTDMDTAYRALRRYSRDNNLKLSAVAAAVVRNEVDLDAVLSSHA